MKTLTGRILKNSLLAATVALSLASTAQSFARNNLPDLGTAAVNTLSMDKEMQYGDIYMRVIRAQAPVLYDPLLAQYISELGGKLVSHANDVRTPFYFFMLQNDQINAFAFFGGHVAVHSGLFLYADDESELASVLSHEITHVTQRHLARSMEAQSRNAPLTLAGVLGAILLTVAAPQAGMAALMGTQALSTQSRINFTRQNEQEADRIGMRVMVAAGYDPRAMSDFFGKLAQKYRYTTKLPPMLLTHPIPESRLSEARDRAAMYKPTRVPPSLNFQLAKARVEVRFSSYSAAAALGIFQKQLDRRTFAIEDAALYGKALALFRMNEFAKTEKIIDKLLAKDPNNLFYLDTKTDLLTQRKDYDQAIALLSGHLKYRPTSLVLNTNLANVYLENKQPEKALPILEQMSFEDKNNLLPVQMMHEAYHQMGDKAQEYYTNAQLKALHADYKGAIDQLNFSYREATGRPLLIARIEAQLRQFRDAEELMKRFQG